MSNPNSPPEGNSIEQGKAYLLGVLSQHPLVPAAVQTAISALHTHYGTKIAALVLHETGLDIARMQQVWTQIGQHWHTTVQLSGNTPQRLHAQAQQIYREASGDAVVAS